MLRKCRFSGSVLLSEGFSEWQTLSDISEKSRDFIYYSLFMACVPDLL